jgi:hypothetical protein
MRRPAVGWALGRAGGAQRRGQAGQRIPQRLQGGAVEGEEVGGWLVQPREQLGLGLGAKGVSATVLTRRSVGSIRRTVTALGTGYTDVSDLFNASKAVRSSTLFGSVTLFREDDSLVVDPRVTTLYPPWECASLNCPGIPGGSDS